MSVLFFRFVPLPPSGKKIKNLNIIKWDKNRLKNKKETYSGKDWTGRRRHAVAAWCFIISGFPVYDWFCLPKSTARQGKSRLVCVLFPSYSHSPCFGFNWLFFSLLSLSLHSSIYVSTFSLLLSVNLSLCFSYCLSSCLSPNYVCQSVRLSFSLLLPAEGLCLCQVLAWVACFHMEVFRR